MTCIQILKKVLVLFGVTLLSVPVFGQVVWTSNFQAVAGPVVQVTVPSSGAKNRVVFVVFEYARQCDPIFSFVEISGETLGKPVKQSVLYGSKIGVVINGQVHTGHAAQTQYVNGFETGFGITNELFDLLTGNVDSLAYITPEGERIFLPTSGFKPAIASALEICAKRFR
jgi:hypothetical protein